MWRRFWDRATNRSVAARCALVVAAGLLGIALWWNVGEARTTWDHVDAFLVAPTEGSVEIVRCDAGSESKGNWTCHGPFTSDDGRVRIDSVDLRVPLEARPGSVWSGVVSGPDTERAWLPDWGLTLGRLGVHLIAGFTAYLAWTLLHLTWLFGERERPVLRGARSPRRQRNQHRRRRRKPARLRRR